MPSERCSSTRGALTGQTNVIPATWSGRALWSIVCHDQRLMIVESDYRGFRIEAVAVEAEGAWDAELRILGMLSEARARVEHLICRRPTAKTAEQRAVMRARRWIDQLIATARSSASLS